ncbi:MAG: ribokinase [Planctomycetes bacterium]|nr:ribokinase [Planctomycetota bacterium]
MRAKIAMIGSANIDFIVQLPHLPVKGETVSGCPFNQAFGGKGSNQAVAARRAGGEVAVVVSVGGDTLGADYLEMFRLEGIDISHSARQEGVACGVALIQVDKNGDNTIAIAPGANELLSPAQVVASEPAIASANLVMLQMEIPDESIEKAIQVAADNGVEVMLNCAPCRPTSITRDHRIGILVVNETEAEGLTGVAVNSPADAEVAAGKLQQSGGHRLVIITMGANGCVTLEDGSYIHHQSYKIDAVDATAAGDAFCGALAVSLAEGASLNDAIRFASAAGALTASRMGAAPSIPTRLEIDEFLSLRG